jgi:RNA ligase (TIGR02306 family)
MTEAGNVLGCNPRFRGFESLSVLHFLTKNTGGNQEIFMNTYHISDFRVKKNILYEINGYIIKYRVEDIKRFPNVLEIGEEVIVTEKINGRCAYFGYHPKVNQPIVTSKESGDNGFALNNIDANKDNLYMKVFNSIRSEENPILTFRRLHGFSHTPFYIIGEIYGKGIAEFDYGIEIPQFRVLDIYMGEPRKGEYLNIDDLKFTCKDLYLKTSPILYRGPFSKEMVEEYTKGNSELGGNHVREGIVITPLIERNTAELGRVKLKSMNEELIKNG